jgi:hypothetical protein
MVGEWRIRLIFLHQQYLYTHFILPVSANVDDIIKLCYGYVNHIGINVEYKLDFNINQPLYIRPLSSDDIYSLVTSVPIIDNNMFGAVYISDVNRYTPLAAIYSMNDISIWTTYGIEKEILIGCTVNGCLPQLKELPIDIQLLSDHLRTPWPKVDDRLMEVTVQYLINDEEVYYNMKDFKMSNSILPYIIDVNITNCWVVKKGDPNISQIVAALKINQHLLPRVVFTGFNTTTRIYSILAVGESLCDGKEFIMIFGTGNFNDRTGDSSMRAMKLAYPSAVEYGRRQYQVLAGLGETIWQG